MTNKVAKLTERYKQNNIGFVSNPRTRKYYFTIISAPYCVEGIANEPGTVRLTGHCVFAYGSIDPNKDFDFLCEKVKKDYSAQYADNPIMLSYLR